MLVLRDDDTCADIPNDTTDENEDMEDSDEDSVETNAANITVEIRSVETEHSLIDAVINVDT